VKRKDCNTDIEEDITGFNAVPYKVALPHATWCRNVRRLLCCVLFWMVCCIPGSWRWDRIVDRAEIL